IVLGRKIAPDIPGRLRPAALLVFHQRIEFPGREHREQLVGAANFALRSRITRWLRPLAAIALATVVALATGPGSVVAVCRRFSTIARHIRTLRRELGRTHRIAAVRRLGSGIAVSIA